MGMNVKSSVRIIGAFILMLSTAIHARSAAEDVSATPGVIQGVIHFIAPIVPDSITVDARDSNNKYTAQVTAVQGANGCSANSPDWCYSITVESALANS